MATIEFNTLPSSVNDINNILQGKRTDYNMVCALTVVALCKYKSSPDECYEMLNALCNPAEPITEYTKHFIRDRLRGKEYKPFSYFKGATPENGYTPSTPYRIEIYTNSYSFLDNDYADFLLKSSGADSERKIKLRKKPSTGEWFLKEIYLLPDIRIPASEDPWA